MIADQQADAVEGLRPIGLLVDWASRLVQAVALPSPSLVARTTFRPRR
jgi:hypothetical protein